MPERKTIQLGPQATRVLTLAMQGFSDKEIAAELRITPVTVRTHFARLCARYGANNRCQLAHMVTGDPAVSPVELSPRPDQGARRT